MALLRYSKAAGWLEDLGLRPYLLKARDYLRQPRRSLSYDLAIRRDLTAFRKQYARLLQSPRPRGAADKRVLIVSLSPHIYRLKLETFVAKALHERGYAPYFLTYRSTPVPNHPSRYFQSARFGATLFFEDFLPRAGALKAEIRKETERFLDRARTNVSDLQDFRYRGVHIGEHVLSSLSRTLHLGRITLDRPDAAAFLRRVVPEALANVVAAEALIDRVKPDLLMFHDTSYVHYGPIHDVALDRGCNVFQFAFIAEDDALVLKRCTEETRRTHPNSLSSESWEYAKRMPWTARQEEELRQHFQDRYGARWFMSRRNQHNKVVKSREQVHAELGLDASKKTVVLFSHILWDANLFFGEDLFDDFGEWFLETARVAYANTSVNWIIKLHPGNIWKRISEGWHDDLDEVALLQSKLGPLPSHVRLLRPETDLNTFSLFDVADYAITVRGTIGVELSCFGKPVFTAGTGRYSGLGFTIDSSSREEYLDRLRQVHTYPPLTPSQTEMAKRHAYALFILRPWRFQSMKSTFMPLEQGNHPLAWDLSLVDPNVSQLSSASDFKALVDWVGRRDKVDYLAPVGIVPAEAGIRG